ncbi:immune inhibitor A domain-containing protein [Teredinibacter turnerae]|uniref:immune inhibitor A domain-containing protein n=1 Tax=Teredinibacter turnerae TaxID=2426 RepID=UPI00036C8EAE|nr:immune inhibitor A domain-containing protein [Teredinibacter turnerae]
MPLRFCSSIVLSLCLLPAAYAAKAPQHHSGGPFDLAIANEEKLISMLKKSGKISSTASRHEAEQALYAILRQRQQAAQAASLTVSESPTQFAVKHQKNKKFTKASLMPGSVPNGGAVRNVVVEPYDGEKKTAKLLTILMEFPDYPHNAVSAGDTDFYYEDYNKEHYAELLFSEEDFAGPNGESLITMQGYYDAQSGGSYGVSGTVAGWYMASQPAAYYGGNDPTTENDIAPRELVTEALLAAQADPTVNLADFDVEDRYDLDGDGDYWEPDGLVDHVQVIHSSVGEEAGGGALGDDAIWSHRWNLGDILFLEDTPTDAPYWDGVMAAYDYTIQPIDAAAGVICHEYGHDLGLPDEYDTQYSGRGEPVSFWSLMSSGSWTGKIAGTQPSGFSPWAKEYLQSTLSGNWQTGVAVSVDDLDAHGAFYLLDEAVTKGTNNDAIRVDLPPKKTVILEPYSGDMVYFSGSGNDLFNVLSVTVDLTGATTADLSFMANYDIETDWDYAYVTVDGVPIPGNVTTTSDPNGQNLGYGITGATPGWVEAQFDLSPYVGAVVELGFYYVTDSYVSNPGFYMDDIKVEVDGVSTLLGDADGEDAFIYDGFTKDGGYVNTEHYYLLEWRTHHGIDEGLKYIGVADSYMSTNEGLVVWYYDSLFGTDNWVGNHPGEGFLGVVDADQSTLLWSDGYPASTRYQIHDAAFGVKPARPVNVTIPDGSGSFLRLVDRDVQPEAFFRDHWDYISPLIPDAGKLLPEYGLMIRVVDDSPNGSVGKVRIANRSK